MEEINAITRAYLRLKEAKRKIINLVEGNPVSQNFHFPSEILHKGFQDYINNPYYEPESKGSVAAREAIHRYYISRNMPSLIDNIILCSGTSEAYRYVFEYLCSPGDHILMPTPSYPLLEYITKSVHASIRYYQLDENQNWSIDFSSLEAQIDHTTKGIVLISPHNPTGHICSNDEKKRLYEIAERYQVALIWDEVFSEFCWESGDSNKYLHDDYSPLSFTLNGISKMFALPWAKLAWIKISGQNTKWINEASDSLETIADTYLSCNTWIQHSLPAIFQYGKDFMNQYITEVNHRRKMMLELLKSMHNLRFIEPQGGFYLVCAFDLPENTSEEDLIIRLLEQYNTYIFPGYYYDIPIQDERIGHFVLSFLSNPQDIQEGIENIKDLLKHL